MPNGVTRNFSSGTRIAACGVTSASWEISFRRSGMRYVCAIVALGFAILSTSSGGLRAATQQQQAAAPSPQQALINQYCVTCHNQRLKTANVMFDTMSVTNVSDNPVVWERAVR